MAESTTKGKKPVQAGITLIRKMKTFFARMDMDGDGFITKKDYELLGERYAKLANLDQAHAKQGMQQLAMDWDHFCTPIAVDGKVTPGSMAELIVNTDSKMAIASSAICFSFIFNLMDKDHVGYVTKETFRLFHQVLNIHDEIVTLETFKILDQNKDGQLSYMEFIEAGIDYFLTDDPNCPYNCLMGPLEK